MTRRALKFVFFFALIWAFFTVSEEEDKKDKQSKNQHEGGTFHFVFRNRKNDDPLVLEGGYAHLKTASDFKQAEKAKPTEIFSTDEPDALKKAEDLQKKIPGSHITVIPVSDKVKNFVLGKPSVRPTTTDVFLGFVNGSIRAITAGSVWLAVGSGVNQEMALAITSLVTSRTLLRDIFLKRVDQFYSDVSRKVANVDKDFKPEAIPNGERTWAQWWKEFKVPLANFAARQSENLFFLEIVRGLASIGGASPHFLTPEGQLKILTSILGPGLSGTYLAIKRSEALKSDAAKRWLNFNFFIAGAVFQALNWAHGEGWFWPTAVVASNIAFDVTMGKLMHRFPRTFEKIGEAQERAFASVKEKVAQTVIGCKQLLARIPLRN